MEFFHVSKCCSEVYVDERTQRLKAVTSVIHSNDPIHYHWECCNGSIYNWHKQACCKNVVVNLPEDFYSRNFKPICCGSQVIADREKEFCVQEEERIVSRENGNQVFCDGKLHQISGDEELVVYCVKDEVWQLLRYEQLCFVNGTYEKYDVRKSVCVANEVPVDDVANRKTMFACVKWTKEKSRYPVPDLFYRPVNSSKVADTDYYQYIIF